MSHASVIPERSLTQHMAILGKTGSGKTFAAKGIVERLLSDGRQVCHVSGTFSTYMSRLRGLELVSGSRGATTASEELFS